MGMIEQLNTIKGRLAFTTVNWLMNRPAIWKTYREFKTTEFASEDELNSLQLARLKAILTRAASETTFYKRRFKEAGFNPGDVRDLDDIKQLPPLTREDLANHRDDMVIDRYQPFIAASLESKYSNHNPNPIARFSRQKMVSHTTSGSTGTPVRFYADGTIESASWAREILVKDRYGLTQGVREARFYRPVAEHKPSKKTLFRKMLWNHLIFPASTFDPKTRESIVQQLRAFHARVWFILASTARLLADYLEEAVHDPEEIAPDLILNIGATLTPNDDEVIKKILGCHIADLYSTQELGHIATSCPESRLHINQETHLVEFEENDPGVDGSEIMVTPLLETPMPLIRYKPGDLVNRGTTPCPCGRKHQILKEILGRTADLYTTASGKAINPRFWYRLFIEKELQGKIKRYQLVYENDRELRIRIVRMGSYDDDSETFIRDKIQLNFKNDLLPIFEYLDQIPHAHTGKFKTIVNKFHYRGKP